MIKYFKDLTTCCIFFPPGPPEKFLADAVNVQFSSSSYKYKIPYTVTTVCPPPPPLEEEEDIPLKKNLVVRVLYSHGNGDSLYYIQRRMQEIAEGLQFGLSHEYRVEVVVLAWTYPTYPGWKSSSGGTTEKIPLTASVLQECSTAVWEELNNIPTTYFKAEDQLVELVEVAIGYSVGSYCASYLASLPSHAPDIVLLLSPFATLPAGNNGRYKYTQQMTGALLDNVELLQRNRKSKVFAIFASEDTILPFDHNSEITLDGKVEFASIQGDHEVLSTSHGIRLAMSQLVELVVEQVENPLIPNSNVVVLQELPREEEEEEEGGGEGRQRLVQQLQKLNITSIPQELYLSTTDATQLV